METFEPPPTHVTLHHHLFATSLCHPPKSYKLCVENERALDANLLSLIPAKMCVFLLEIYYLNGKLQQKVDGLALIQFMKSF